ncbi:LIM-domain-containing protein [Dentipellis sp. KUC8613]|nr:LIM-domain-containing protein [Dentipellis sp. KUC8613]
MHPFGGTPICPRCSKAVYAAEQVMGPGRKLYHKPCLACVECNKRLDSLSLLEHDQEPYCKNCHSKRFGTRDLRQANLPHRPDLAPLSPTRTGTSFASPTSPTRGGAYFPNPTSPTRSVDTPSRTTTSPPPLPNRKPVFATATLGRANTGGTYGARMGSPEPLLRPTRALSPTRATFGSPSATVRANITGSGAGASFSPRPVASQSFETLAEQEEDAPPAVAPEPAEHTTPEKRAESPVRAEWEVEKAVTPPPALPPRNNGTPATMGRSASNGSVNGSSTPVMHMNLTGTVGRMTSTPTGTRYGVGLTGGLRATPTGNRAWGGGTPQCPKCGKSVYFAEQVKAVGKTYHKACLRCTECGTSLDSSRLTEKDGQPMCRRCYSKLFGPQGSGYALLGKAGA